MAAEAGAAQSLASRSTCEPIATAKGVPPRVGRGSKAQHERETWIERKPPSLNGFPTEESRGPASAPAIWYALVVQNWPDRPSHLGPEWNKESKDYQQVKGRWRTLCGDGERRVEQRKASSTQVNKYNGDQSARMSIKREKVKQEKHVCLLCLQPLTTLTGRAFSERHCAEWCQTREQGGSLHAACVRYWLDVKVEGDSRDDERPLPVHLTPRQQACPYCWVGPAKMFRPATPGSKRSRVEKYF